MARATAEVEAVGMRPVAEVNAERCSAAALVQAHWAEARTVVKAAEDWMVFDRTSCPTVWFSTHWNCW